MSKVKMPEPVALHTVMPDGHWYGHVYGYTATHMKAYASAVRREALEEAALLVDGCHPKATHRGIAAAIRALI